jgi:predicted NUDIX family phosphoesterase
MGMVVVNLIEKIKMFKNNISEYFSKFLNIDNGDAKMENENFSEIVDNLLDKNFNADEQKIEETAKENVVLSKYNNEKVLVFKKDLISQEDIFHGMIINDKARNFREKYLIPENLFYIDRDIAENDKSYKQVIPYCFITRGTEVFCYQRSSKGSENRLHEMYSLGVGGHINPVDGNSNETLSLACKRELDEEISYSGFAGSTFVGLINDDSDDVNSVHFGVVFHVKLQKNGEVNPKENKLINSNFMEMKQASISATNWENWSIFLLRGYIRNNLLG